MTAPHYADDAVTLYHGDALEVMRTLEAGSVDCVVTSPPYFGLRDYGVEGQLGAEAAPAEYVENLRALFSEIRRALADDGTAWLNLGDSYATGSKWGGSTDGKHARALHGDGVGGRGRTNPGLPAKNLLGIPWRVAFALQDDGWILRNEIIWAKPNGMPESVTDRLAGKHEHVFMFAKSPRYRFDLDPIRVPIEHPGVKRTIGKFQQVGDGHNPAHRGLLSDGHALGKNPGDVWSIPTSPFPGAHFATMPAALAERCILAGCKPGGTVLDPFSGSGTTGMAAAKHGRRYVGIDLNEAYLKLSLRTRLQQPGLDLEATS